MQITNKICNIVKVKVAKNSEITDFNDFETKGQELQFTEGKDVNITYTALEDDTYVFYIEDELGNKKMIEKRITSEEKVMNIEIDQDKNSPGNLTIKATNNICNIVEMKIAIGEDIHLSYFENNGEEIYINAGKEVTTNYTVDENCTVNVYIKDEQGYTYLYRKQIIGLEEPEPVPNEPPEITLTQNADNLKQIDVKVRDTDSYIDEVKWARGSQTVHYFATNGTRIGQGSVGSSVNTHFKVTETGIYTVYAKDQDGNKVVKEINITNIEEPEVEDTISPTVKTTNEFMEENKTVKVIIDVVDTQSTIKTIKIATGEQNIKYFENNGTTLNIKTEGNSARAEVGINSNGTYTIYAEDEKGNSVIKVIKITEVVEEPEPTDDTITSSEYKIDTNSNYISKIIPETNLTEFNNKISTKIGYKVVNLSGEEIQDSDLIGTGYKLITDTNKEYKLIVTGDLNSDGNINLIDLSRIRKYHLKLITIQEEYQKAADANYDNEVNLIDLSIVRKVSLKIIEL